VYEELDVQIAGAKERLHRLGELRASLAPTCERLTQEARRVQRIDDCLAEVECQIQVLESFTLQSLLDSLLWKKEGKLNHLRDELARLRPEYETGERNLLELDAAVEATEAEIADLSNAEDIYKALCDQKYTQILAEGGEAAKQLEELATQRNAAKNKRQSLRKCLQVAKNLIDRLRTMGSALGRANTKKMRYGPLGVIGYVAVNAIQRQSAGPAVQRVCDGVEELCRCIAALPLRKECARDVELARLAASIDAFRGELAGSKLERDSGFISLIMEQINLATCLLEAVLDEVEPIVTSLEAERLQLIENA
jgi:hypothetical protein